MSAICADRDLAQRFADFADFVSGVDVRALGQEDLSLHLADVRRAQRCLDGLVVRIGARTEELAATGAAAPADELLRGAGDVGAGQARREAARVAVVEELPQLGALVAAGRTTGEHVDAVARQLARVATDQMAELPAEKILTKAQALPPETFGRFMKRTVDLLVEDHGLSDTVAKQEASEFRHWYDQRAGMGRFAGALDPERYEILVNAVDRQTSELATRQQQPHTPGLAAAALVHLVQQRGSSANGRPSIIVVVDQDTALDGGHSQSIRRTENGHDIPPETVARLSCDAVLRRVILDDRGVPLQVGRKYRTATDGQWAAIKAVHSSCAWDGCSAPIAWCQAHHITEWEAGGRTDLANLVPLCNAHHHRVHEGRWNLRLQADRTLDIFRPDGRLHASVPTPMRC